MQQIDISVCIQPIGGYPFRLLPAFTATFPRRVKASAVAVQFPTEVESCLPGSQPSPSSLRDATSPERGSFWRARKFSPCI